MEKKNNFESEINKAGKTNPFQVPSGYFESFPEKIQGRLHTEEPEVVSLADRIWQIARPQLSLAAAIIAFALIGYLGFYTFIRTDSEALSDDVISEYIDSHEDEFSDYYLMSMLDYNEIESGDAAYFDDTDTYIEYLDHEDIDIDLIVTEY